MPTSQPNASHEAHINAEKEAMYEQLNDCLAAQRWHDADQITYALMSTIIGKPEREIKYREIEAFPCDELHRIDQLWVQHSDGKFGFSVQKRIWDEICDTEDDYSWSGYENRRSKFCERVGWLKNCEVEPDYYKRSVQYATLCLSKNGQLPNGRATNFFAKRHFDLGWSADYWHGYEATADEYGFYFDSLMMLVAACQLPTPSEKSIAILLEELAHSSDIQLRRSAAYALGKSKSETAILGLLRAIDDPDYYIPRYAADALGLIEKGIVANSNDLAAIRSHTKALVSARENSNLSAELSVLQSLSPVYMGLGQYGKAIASYQQALQVAQTLTNRHAEAYALGSLGSIYYTLRHFPKAIHYYEQAAQRYQKIQDSHGEATALINLGVLYLEMSQCSKAIEYFQWALVLHQQSHNQTGEAYALMNLGVASDALTQYPQAIQYYEQAQAIFESLQDHEGKAQALDRIRVARYFLPEVGQSDTI